MRLPLPFGFPCCGPVILLQPSCASRPDLVSPLICPSASLVHRLTDQLPISPPLASVSAGPRRRRISALRPAPSHLQRSSRRCGDRGVSGLQTAEGSWCSAKTLRLAFSFGFLIRLALLGGLFLSFAACPSGSRFTTIYGMCWEENEGIWELEERRALDGARLDQHWKCIKNRTWPHTSLLYDVHLSIDTTSFTR